MTAKESVSVDIGLSNFDTGCAEMRDPGGRLGGLSLETQQSGTSCSFLGYRKRCTKLDCYRGQPVVFNQLVRAEKTGAVSVGKTRIISEGL